MLSGCQGPQASPIFVVEMDLGEFKDHTRKSQSCVTIEVFTSLVVIYFGLTAQIVVKCSVGFSSKTFTNRNFI